MTDRAQQKLGRGLVAPLFDGPVDVVGDIHGEIGALVELLAQLGYDAAGRHPEGRRLVFVGDLCDRGPDSPAVIELVRGMVGRKTAQCVLGNHELNLLRSVLKVGNEWFMDPTHPRAQPGGEFAHSRAAPEAMKPVWLEFFASLPLALEREDLRVVHAAWVPSEIAELRVACGAVLEVYDTFETRTALGLAHEGILDAARVESKRWGEHLENRSATVPLLTALGTLDEREQMGNPVKVTTSGTERLAVAPFWSSGKWRMCVRVSWWEAYGDAVPVIVGHYWRQAARVTAADHVLTKPEMFADVGPTEWVGRRRNVYCVDFSVGARYQERKQRLTRFQTHLGAVRFPEREIWFETGRVG